MSRARPRLDLSSLGRPDHDRQQRPQATRKNRRDRRPFRFDRRGRKSLSVVPILTQPVKKETSALNASRTPLKTRLEAPVSGFAGRPSRRCARVCRSRPPSLGDEKETIASAKSSRAASRCESRTPRRSVADPADARAGCGRALGPWRARSRKRLSFATLELARAFPPPWRSESPERRIVPPPLAAAQRRI
jgi:hypothetical protein